MQDKDTTRLDLFLKEKLGIDTKVFFAGYEKQLQKTVRAETKIIPKNYTYSIEIPLQLLAGAIVKIAPTQHYIFYDDKTYPVTIEIVKSTIQLLTYGVNDGLDKTEPAVITLPICDLVDAF